MICFDNGHNSLRNAREFGLLDTRLNPILELLELEYKMRQCNLTVTSVHRTNSSDHMDYRAVDLRVYGLREKARLEIEKTVNEEFPAPTGERPTIKYWHGGNSNGKYAPHYHLRVPKTVARMG